MDDLKIENTELRIVVEEQGQIVRAQNTRIAKLEFMLGKVEEVVQIYRNYIEGTKD